MAEKKMAENKLLSPGQTCWRTVEADRFAPIVDGADYLRCVKSAMLGAENRILLIGWDFDARTTFEPGGGTLPGPNQLGPFLFWLLWRRPHLKVYVLKSNLRLLPVFERYWYSIVPVQWLNRITSARMHLAVDGAHPTGAVHHQKVVVIDDAVAFCGGIDLTLGRWDTRAHDAVEPGRRAAGEAYGPRHEVATVVDGEAARSLAELARDRWEMATGQALPPVGPGASVWPQPCEPALRHVQIGIARTLPSLPERDEVREVEALNLAAIGAARKMIYLENQYLAARSICEALAERLRDPDGPEVIIVLPRTSESQLERESMDSARERMLRLLWEADEHDRLGVYWPAVPGGQSLYIHSKIVVVDDRFLRIGSSNLNNRSLGFDSECDVAIEYSDDRDDIRTHIEFVRDDLLAEHLGLPLDTVRAEMRARGSILKAVDTLRGRSLRKFTPHMVSADAGPFAENDLMDPVRVPTSVAVSVLSVAVALVTWPLVKGAPGLWSVVRSAGERVGLPI
ncbi:phospholipase D-like domain-containing protein [Mycolicibacterium bacteremicum]|uniref:phospholipase D-like domain-containing protein n=1 Tax=Mycolicibacterium bacteremicum TaxID=564198 RepID=UPI0026EECAF9|nr:phospholipase D-like domain-containing protein [Mycolicibacterium bacteremicum]